MGRHVKKRRDEKSDAMRLIRFHGTDLADQRRSPTVISSFPQSFSPVRKISFSRPYREWSLRLADVAGAAFRLGSIASESQPPQLRVASEIGTPTHAHCNFRFPQACRDASRLSSWIVLQHRDSKRHLRKKGNNIFRNGLFLSSLDNIYILILEKKYIIFSE